MIAKPFSLKNTLIFNTVIWIVFYAFLKLLYDIKFDLPQSMVWLNVYDTFTGIILTTLISPLGVKSVESRARKHAIHFVVVVIITMLFWTITGNLIYKYIEPSAAQMSFWQLISLGLWWVFYAFFIWTFAFLAWQLREQAKLLEQKSIETELINQKLHFELLIKQLAPHFIFNTLNMVVAKCIEEGAEDTKRMIGLLSDLLRYVTTPLENGLSKISDEIEFAAAYLALQKERYGDRIQVDDKFSSFEEDGIVPVLLIQPLLENYISHAVEHTQDTVSLVIALEKDGDMLHLLAINDKPSNINHAASKSIGSGLNNLRYRLKSCFGENVKVDTGHSPTQFFVKISFPHFNSMSELDV